MIKWRESQGHNWVKRMSFIKGTTGITLVSTGTIRPTWTWIDSF